MIKNGNSEAKEWPYFKKLDNFFSNNIECDTSDSTSFDSIGESDESTSVVKLPGKRS